MAPAYRLRDLVGPSGLFHLAARAAAFGAALGVSLAVTGCAWLPPDSPPPRTAPVDPDAAVVHDWKVADHVLGQRALISELDAAEFHGRTVAVTAAGYASPWSGSCGEAQRARRPRSLAELAAAHALSADRAAQLGLAPPIVEYQLMCLETRTPPLTVYLAGAHAATCWSGVCYVLAR